MSRVTIGNLTYSQIIKKNCNEFIKRSINFNAKVIVQIQFKFKKQSFKICLSMLDPQTDPKDIKSALEEEKNHLE